MQTSVKNGAPSTPVFMIPHPALQPYIRHYIFAKIGTAGSWNVGNMAPQGCTALTIFLNSKTCSVQINDKTGNHYTKVMFTGQVTQYRKMLFYGRFTALWVIFKPCGAYQLMNIGQQECTDIEIELPHIFGADGNTLVQQLADQSTIQQVYAVCEQFFLKRLPSSKKDEIIRRLTYVDKQIRLYSGDNRALIKKICREEGFSIKSLERYMKEIVGVTPKYYQRIIRFKKALKYINQLSSPPNWAQTACQFGYSDQTHFINEFKLFCGITPTAYSSGEWMDFW